MTALRAACLCLLILSGCTPVAVAPALIATQTQLEVGGLNGRVPYSQSLPAIEVRRSDGTGLVRDEWVAAETAAAAHCTGLGATYERLPPARDYTQIRLDDGVFYFMARCLR
ncbi:hypothetical protein [Roseicyclus mahoneyensis]|uniref:Lipoprotein n=1 Tax=Roseicyclus mahoneyensis TaxID=164332 RepID=A0A316H0X7_9RHOB|nr:hypothetical protein [Roseicyclus mahoneyensis]PWK61070.1 hypothetical protein C7455_103270 [Roseicyclus mahoneyensis]